MPIFRSLRLVANNFRNGVKQYQQQTNLISSTSKQAPGEKLGTGLSSILYSREMAHSSSLHTNRLIDEKSPYLLQHAHNPVDWYPWGEEAIERARRENKVIFLSVGYSTCHWCHVMEHESFENPATAKLMNEHFINIKVDREERPDIDKLYMTFILMINGSGGWPMSVFLTPELTPITGGTYFPPQDRWGMPGFPTILKKIHDMWQKDGSKLTTTGQNIIRAIEKHVQEKVQLHETDGDSEHVFKTVERKYKQAVSIYKRNYDDVWGGSNGAPKFPEIAKLNFMLHAFAQSRELLDVALLQLDRMANGGIHDHIFGGFARYSVDEKWHVPHFEKMLYDQGQIMGAYANAFKITRNPKYLDIADKIHTYICSDLRNAKGGFYSGEDADSLPSADSKEKIEGAFYAWTYAEIEDILSENLTKFDESVRPKVLEIFKHHYNVKLEGNVEPRSDPHGHLLEKNILIVFGSVKETAKKFDVTEKQVEEVLKVAHSCLHEVRSKRPRPHLDTKVICAWNGLVLSGLSKLATIKDAPNRQKYLETATDLVKFIRSELYDESTHKLLRSAYGDESSKESQHQIHGFLDDYAFLIRGLIDFYAASLDVASLRFAKELQEKQDELFWDEENGGYFYTEANASNLVVRLKEDHDGAEPCGNSVAAHNLVMLRFYFEEIRYKERLERLFTFFNGTSPFGYVLPEMMSALLTKDAGLAIFVVVGEKGPQVTEFLDIGRDFYVPGMLVLHNDPHHPENITRCSIRDFKMVQNKPTAFVCEKNVCNLPVTDSASLAQEFQKYLAD